MEFVISNPCLIFKLEQILFTNWQHSQIDLKDVDVILISNYQSMLGLPYLTEGTEFRGVVYATEPTIQIAGLFMQEMIQYLERAPRIRTAEKWKRNPDLLKSIPFPLPIDPSLIPTLSTLYSSKVLQSCLSRVKAIGFGERINMFGSLQASAHSSGHSIGSCNWIIRSDHEKIVYLSASSTMTTHPKPMEIQLLANPDALILSSMTTAPAHNPDSSLMELCKCMSKSLSLSLSLSLSDSRFAIQVSFLYDPITNERAVFSLLMALDSCRFNLTASLSSRFPLQSSIRSFSYILLYNYISPFAFCELAENVLPA